MLGIITAVNYCSSTRKLETVSQPRFYQQQISCLRLCIVMIVEVLLIITLLFHFSCCIV